jgi:hypothetical protein
LARRDRNLLSIFAMKLSGMLVTLLMAAELAHGQTTTPRGEGSSRVDPVFLAEHDAALTRAKVWFTPRLPIGSANLGVTKAAPDGFAPEAIVSCRFKVEGVAGSTPKFVCVLPDGDDFKVKYGRNNAEVYTEVAATRLLDALGFPADRMYPASQVPVFE